MRLLIIEDDPKLVRLVELPPHPAVSATDLDDFLSGARR